jgi:RNA polymerase sigma factor (TIGR02999 family)
MSTEPPSGSGAALVVAWRGGDGSALNRLVDLLYTELHALARRHLRSEASGHTLQTTALINECYLRLVGGDVDWKDRVHFLAVAATTMRRVLVDHARARRSAKRGGDVTPVTFDDAIAATGDRTADVLELDEALERLFALDQRKARVIELVYFGGLTYHETAMALDLSEATVHRELRLAKAWLYRELSSGERNAQ